jgi:DNA-binding GntR family transcriptional regulator
MSNVALMEPAIIAVMAPLAGDRPMSTTRNDSNVEHRRYIEAIANHDAASVASLMQAHLQAVRQIMFGDL